MGLNLPNAVWWAHLRRLAGDARNALAHTSTMPTRLMLAIASTLHALLLPFAGGHWARLVTMPAMEGTSAHVAAVIAFLVSAAGLWWRLIESRPRQAWAQLINSFTAGLWLCVVVVLCFSGLAPFVAAPVGLCLASIWVALRSGVTYLDRRQA
jgi:hypothetical protein